MCKKMLFLGLIASSFFVLTFSAFSSTAGRYGQVIVVARQYQTFINEDIGILYKLDRIAVNQGLLAQIDRNLTSWKNIIRGFEGYMFRLPTNPRQSPSNDLTPLSDSQSKIKNPPKAVTLVKSGKIYTKAARQWLQLCITFLQASVKALSAANAADTSGRQSPPANNDANSLTNIYG